MQQLKGFALHLDRLKINACGVATWVIDAIDEADRGWIGTAGKYDWDCGSRGFSRERCGRTARRCNHAHISAYKIGRQFWQSIILTIRPTKIDVNILTFDKS